LKENVSCVRFCRGAQVALAAVLLFALCGVSQAFERPVVKAGLTGGPIRLDGYLNEPEWKAAGSIPELVQQEPEPGKPTPYHTEVRLLVDGENLYVGVVCKDPHPDRIAIHTMMRDGDLEGDDTVGFVLDTFGDQRTGYFFRVNAAGARQDGLVSGPEEISTDWDGLWDARTRLTPDGWTAEVRIPTRSLRFTPGADRWGFNVERMVARDRVVLRWCSATLDSRLYDFRRAGWLAGVAGLEQGLGIEVRPYGLSHSNRTVGAGPAVTTGDFGADLSYSFTPELTGVVTVNTDFAETEVDSRRINLTRFSLFFPEKRAFFLEGSNVFGFGVGLRHDFIPFFSRRVGLFEGEQVPLLGAVKVLGRSGRWVLGFLDAATDRSSLTERSNLFAGRVSYNVNDNLALGTIATRGDPDGVHENELLGLDALWQTSSFRGDKNFAIGGWGAWSGGDVPEGSPWGLGFKVDYPNDLWDLSVTFKQFGEALDPALGFLPRPGTRWYSFGGAFQPRPGDGFFGWVRQFYFETFATCVEKLGEGVESWRVFTAPFNVQTESGEHLEANFIPQFEHPSEPFEVSEGVIIPAGEYRYTRYRVEAQSSDHRPWRVGSTVWFGGFYTGTLIQWESYAGYTTPGGHLQIGLEMENDFGSLPEGDFVERLSRLRVAWAFDPDLILSSYGQYDSETRNVGFNTRLRWTIRPGNDLYVIWNHSWEEPVGVSGWRSLRPLDGQLMLKLRWTFWR